MGAAGLIRVVGSTPDSNTALRVPTFSARWGSARLQASGYSGDTLAIEYDLIAPHLATFAPAAAGSLSARGTVTGPRATPEIVATVQGSGIRYAANSVARLNGQADVAMAPDGALDVTLHGRRAAVGTTVLDSVLLAIRGTRSAHRIDLRAGGPAATARLAATGGLDSSGTRWAGRLDTLRIQGSPIGSWHLTTRPALAVGGSGGHSRSAVPGVIGHDALAALRPGQLDLGVRLGGGGAFSTVSRWRSWIPSSPIRCSAPTKR